LAEEQPVRVVKKAPGHGAHHGGAWKVALADFMTAMMAFFLVMWILGLNEETRRAVEGYFNDPVGFSAGYQNGRDPFATTGNPEGGKKGTGSQLAKAVAGAEKRVERRTMEATKREIEQELEQMRGSSPLVGAVELTMTDQGLRIDLVDRTDVGFFDIGSARLNPQATELLKMLGRRIAKLPNSVIIEGHTDSRLYAGSKYTNWELSADRANMARRVLAASGRPEQLVQVVGYADTMLGNKNDPLHHTNRRVSILIRYSDKAMREELAPLARELFAGIELEPDIVPGP
jgi:chemotaxis protein MotB